MPGVSARSKATPRTRPDDTRYAPLTGSTVYGARGASPVVCYGTAPNGTFTNSGTATGYTIRQAYKTALACTDLQVVLPVWYVTNTTQAAAPNPISYKAAIEYNGNFYPINFNGVRTITPDGGSTVTSDALALELPANASFWLRMFVNTASGSLIAGNNLYGSIVYGADGSYTTGDSVDAVTVPGSHNSNLPTPLTILGRPLLGGAAYRCLVGVGDSIMAGKGDIYASTFVDTSGRGTTGWFQRGLNNQLPAIVDGVSSITAQTVAAGTGHIRSGAFYSLGTHAVVMLGTNDIFVSSRTAAQVEADLTTMYTTLVNRGLKVYGCTILPQTTSSDSWATSGGQTLKSQESVRVAVNTWIRSVPAPLSGILETADLAETARNSGLWVTNGTASWPTTDGIHPASPVSTLIAGAMNISQFN